MDLISEVLSTMFVTESGHREMRRFVNTGTDPINEVPVYIKKVESTDGSSEVSELYVEPERVSRYNLKEYLSDINFDLKNILLMNNSNIENLKLLGVVLQYLRGDALHIVAKDRNIYKNLLLDNIDLNFTKLVFENECKSGSVCVVEDPDVNFRYRDDVKYIFIYNQVRQDLLKFYEHIGGNVLIITLKENTSKIYKSFIKEVYQNTFKYLKRYINDDSSYLVMDEQVELV